MEDWYLPAVGLALAFPATIWAAMVMLEVDKARNGFPLVELKGVPATDNGKRRR